MHRLTRILAFVLATGVSAWATPASTSPSPSFPNLTDDPLYDQDTYQALRDVVIDVAWNREELGRAMTDLTLAVRSARPISAEVNFFVSSSATPDFRHRDVSIVLKRTPIFDLLVSLSQQAGFTIKVHPGVVLIVPR